VRKYSDLQCCVNDQHNEDAHEKEASTPRPVLAEIGHSADENRPLLNSE
jgi:hypothetical protein